MKQYSNEFKNELCTLICINGESTSKTAKKYHVPLKTVEKWITAFNKDSSCFERPDDYYNKIRDIQKHRYDQLSKAQLIKEIKKRDTIVVKLMHILSIYDQNVYQVNDKSKEQMQMH